MSPRCGYLSEASAAPLPPCERVLLSFDERLVRMFLLDAAPLYGLAQLFCLVLAGLLTLLALRLKGTLPARGDRMKYVHLLVVRLPVVLPVTLALGTAMFAGAIVLITPVVAGGDQEHPHWFAVIVLVLRAAALAAPVFFVFGRLSSSTRKAFGLVADVIGFWPIHWHPLSGRSYRDDVVAGLREIVADVEEQPIVVVGHSQGSVLALWAMTSSPPSSTSSPPSSEVHLVTCGSPIASLYGTFFPATFDIALVRSVHERVVSWRNYWRDTDPIATALPMPVEDGGQAEAVDVVNRQLADDALPHRGHSDYWIDRTMQDDIACVLSAPSLDRK